MASDYNANLIAELYATSDADEATRICDEMLEIGDAVFPRQIFEAYKRFENSIVSHYFISDLMRFKTPAAGEFIKEIAHTTKSSADLSMMTGFLASIQYFEPYIVARIHKIFQEEVFAHKIQEYDIDDYCRYLLGGGVAQEALENLLQACFEDDKQTTSARRAALKQFLKMNPKKNVAFFYDNYDSIKGKKLEVVFVQEISTWHGGIIPMLHEKILSDGSDRAKEILRAEQQKNAAVSKAKEISEQADVKAEFETADVVSDIAELRQRINKFCIADDRFGFALFLASEELYQQGRAAKDKPTLVGYLMVLRSTLDCVTREVLDFDITQERAAELAPEIKEINRSINRLHLLLLDKGIRADSGLFGMRNLSRIITKFGAHTSEATDPELLKLLEEESLVDCYKEDKWTKLHREILLKYKRSLILLMESISEKKSPKR